MTRVTDPGVDNLCLDLVCPELTDPGVDNCDCEIHPDLTDPGVVDIYLTDPGVDNYVI